LPSFLISALLALVWLVGYAFTPIAKHKREHTWADVFKVRFDRMEGSQFTIFGALSVLGVVLFSLIDEDGNELPPYMANLVWIFTYTFGFLLFFLVYDFVNLPRLFSPLSTTRDESSPSVPSPQSFRISSVDNNNSGGFV